MDFFDGANFSSVSFAVPVKLMVTNCVSVPGHRLATECVQLNPGRHVFLGAV